MRIYFYKKEGNRLFFDIENGNITYFEGGPYTTDPGYFAAVEKLQNKTALVFYNENGMPVDIFGETWHSFEGIKIGYINGVVILLCKQFFGWDLHHQETKEFGNALFTKHGVAVIVEGAHGN